jgi:hypothetical protein
MPFFGHEIHPFADLLPTGSHPYVGALRIVEPYFKAEPYIDRGYLDHVGNVDYPSVTTRYCFMHTLSEIMTGLIENGIAIEKFVEYETVVSPEHKPIEAQNVRLPLSYILIGRK